MKNHSKDKIWHDENPDTPGSFICRMHDGYIKMCYWDGEEWGDMWQDGLKGEVTRWMDIPYDDSLVSGYDEGWEVDEWTWDDEDEFKTWNEAPYGDE